MTAANAVEYNKTMLKYREAFKVSKVTAGNAVEYNKTMLKYRDARSRR